MAKPVAIAVKIKTNIKITTNSKLMYPPKENTPVNILCSAMSLESHFTRHTPTPLSSFLTENFLPAFRC